MRRKIVAGNWKMNTELTSATTLVDSIVAGVRDARDSGANVVVCPPFVVLEAVSRRLRDSGVALGAQNLYFEPEGAYTGEISAAMLRSVGCRYVIVGHSERRTLFGETDDTVARKTLAAIGEGLIPIICVGETLEERESDAVREVVSRQMDAALGALSLGGYPVEAVFAYEPVWAIGTGRTATPRQAQEVHELVRERIAAAAGDEHAAGTCILYGGSVNAANATELFSMPDIDGGLIGGASLKSDAFLSIVRAASGT